MNDGVGALGFLGCLREKKSLWLICAALVLGVCFMMFDGTSLLGGRTDVSSLEARVEKLCERVDGVSEISVMITTDTVGAVRGVAVVCKGGEDVSVKLTLTELLSALFGIPSSNVSVVGGK